MKEMVERLNKARIANTITKFQFEVYKLVLTIPEGKVSTYQTIAKEIKCRSSQAIGQALKTNPFAPEVPCHRVVKTDRTLGGFTGSTANKTTEKKMKLLKSEGVVFQLLSDEQVSLSKVKKEHVWNFSVNEQ